MRKSFDGLLALVKHALFEDPLSGSLFLFVNRKRTYVKSKATSVNNRPIRTVPVLVGNW